eukprot:6290985-Prorocentrum_lima.AAC.1
MKTTYVEPSNTNAKVYARANQALKTINPDAKPIRPLDIEYRLRRIQQLAKIICLPEDDTRRSAIFLPPGYVLRHQQYKRPGRPRFQWAQEAMEDYWKTVGRTYREYRWTSFNPSDIDHVQ